MLVVVRAAGAAAAAEALHTATRHLAIGCHRFFREEKQAALRAARDQVAVAACELLLAGGEASRAHAATLEREVVPAIGGLLRRLDRPPRRGSDRE